MSISRSALSQSDRYLLPAANRPVIRVRWDILTILKWSGWRLVSIKIVLWWRNIPWSDRRVNWHLTKTIYALGYLRRHLNNLLPVFKNPVLSISSASQQQTNADCQDAPQRDPPCHLTLQLEVVSSSYRWPTQSITKRFRRLQVALAKNGPGGLIVGPQLSPEKQYSDKCCYNPS